MKRSKVCSLINSHKGEALSPNLLTPMTLTHSVYSSIFIHSSSSKHLPNPTSIHPANASHHLHPAARLWCHKDCCKSAARRQPGAHTKSDTVFEIPVPLLRKYNTSFRYCYLFCMICFGKILLQDKWGTQQGRRMTDSHTDADMLFFPFPPIRRALPATPFQLSAAMAFWVSVWSASLFPVQTESHRRKLCLPSWAPAVGALWSFKATETHVWYFCLYPDWEFQVHVKGTESLQT